MAFEGGIVLVSHRGDLRTTLCLLQDAMIHLDEAIPMSSLVCSWTQSTVETFREARVGGGALLWRSQRRCRSGIAGKEADAETR